MPFTGLLITPNVVIASPLTGTEQLLLGAYLLRQERIGSIQGIR